MSDNEEIRPIIFGEVKTVNQMDSLGDGSVRRKVKQNESQSEKIQEMLTEFRKMQIQMNKINDDNKEIQNMQINLNSRLDRQNVYINYLEENEALGNKLTESDKLINLKTNQTIENIPVTQFVQQNSPVLQVINEASNNNLENPIPGDISELRENKDMNLMKHVDQNVPMSVAMLNCNVPLQSMNIKSSYQGVKLLTDNPNKVLSNLNAHTQFNCQPYQIINQPIPTAQVMSRIPTPFAPGPCPISMGVSQPNMGPTMINTLPYSNLPYVTPNQIPTANYKVPNLGSNNINQINTSVPILPNYSQQGIPIQSNISSMPQTQNMFTGGNIRFVQESPPRPYAEDDDRDFEVFFQKLNNYIYNSCGSPIAKEDCITILLKHLDKALINKLESGKTYMSYENMMMHIIKINQQSKKNKRKYFLEEFAELQPYHGQMLVLFADQLQHLALKAYPEYKIGSELMDSILINKLLSCNLDPQDILDIKQMARFSSMGSTSSSWAHYYQACSIIDNSRVPVVPTIQFPKLIPSTCAKVLATRKIQPNMMGALPDLVAKESNTKKYGPKLNYERFTPKSGQVKPKLELTIFPCNECNGMNHNAYHCPKRINLFCKICKRNCHLFQDCPNYDPNYRNGNYLN